MKNAQRQIIPGAVIIHTGEAGCVLQIDNHLIEIKPEASEVLEGYLKIINAYFGNFPSAGKSASSYCRDVGERLSKITLLTGRAIGSRDVTNIIAQFGCISDWEEWHRN